MNIARIFDKTIMKGHRVLDTCVHRYDCCVAHSGTQAEKDDRRGVH